MPNTLDGRQIVYKLYNRKTGKFGVTGSRGRSEFGSTYDKKPQLAWVALTDECYKNNDDYIDNWEVQAFALTPIE